jgi:hypothetical protein
VDRETKLKIIETLTDDGQVKSLMETLDLDSSLEYEIEEFLGKCFNELETMVTND